MMLHAQAGVSPCQQYISGWTRVPPSDTTVLNTLSLPRENILFLGIPNATDRIASDEE